MTKESCPKCGAARQDRLDCPKCGVIFAKAEAAQKASNTADANRRAEQEKQAAQVAAAAAKVGPCQTCAAPIAKTAKQCPLCGAKQRRPASRMAYLMAGGFVLLLIWSISQSPETAPTPDRLAEAKRLLQERPDLAHKISAKEMCHSALVRSLKDPDSLVIENVEQDYAASTGDDPARVLTSFTIRAKNSFGGYARSTHACMVEIKGGRIIITRFTSA